MAWQIGMDEAGYGPNLGPFVMTLVACRLPDESRDADLWDVMRSAVRRAEESADARCVVADSKLVYSSARGWDQLEKSVLASGVVGSAANLQALTSLVAGPEAAPLAGEAWHTGATSLPTAITPEALTGAADAWTSASAAGGLTWDCRGAIVPAPRFNDIIDRWDSKGAVLSIAMTELMQRFIDDAAPEPMTFVIDKHGGRNQYAAVLQHAFVNGMVLAEEEGRDRSVYRVEGLRCPVRITFRPKADVTSFTVALASMVSKYLRELFMGEFNRFWQSHVPDLAPTAGYPQDAPRFLAAIRPALVKLGIAERLVWRAR